jgi:hypothetical protein
MTNSHLHFAKPTVAARFFALYILSALSFALANTVYAADANADAQTREATTPNYKVTESISIDRLIQKIYYHHSKNILLNWHNCTSGVVHSLVQCQKQTLK